MTDRGLTKRTGDGSVSTVRVRVDELKCKPKYEIWIKLAGLDRRYLWKLACGRMKPKDWFSLLFDILVVVAEFHLKHFKDKFSEQLKK